MKLQAFREMIDSHPALELLGTPDAKAADPVVRVRGISPAKHSAVYEMSLSAITNHSEDELAAVLTGVRGPFVMAHFARIVGYYSNMRNWNFSKLAEARDRHKGDYGVPEPKPERKSV